MDYQQLKEALQCKPRHIYLEISPSKFIGAYFQVSVHRITTLAMYMLCLIAPYKVVAVCGRSISIFSVNEMHCQQYAKKLHAILKPIKEWNLMISVIYSSEEHQLILDIVKIISTCLLNFLYIPHTWTWWKFQYPSTFSMTLKDHLRGKNATISISKPCAKFDFATRSLTFQLHFRQRVLFSQHHYCGCLRSTRKGAVKTVQWQLCCAWLLNYRYNLIIHWFFTHSFISRQWEGPF